MERRHAAGMGAGLGSADRTASTRLRDPDSCRLSGGHTRARARCGVPNSRSRHCLPRSLCGGVGDSKCPHSLARRLDLGTKGSCRRVTSGVRRCDRDDDDHIVALVVPGGRIRVSGSLVCHQLHGLERTSPISITRLKALGLGIWCREVECLEQDDPEDREPTIEPRPSNDEVQPSAVSDSAPTARTWKPTVTDLGISGAIAGPRRRQPHGATCRLPTPWAAMKLYMW